LKRTDAEKALDLVLTKTCTVVLTNDVASY